jgi:hypothetical protein
VKVRRARKHIADIVPQFATVSVDQDKFLKAASIMGLPIGNAAFVSELAIPESALDEIACCVGDAVHNLRSALDLLACEIVERSPDGNPNNVHFPFWVTEAGLTSQVDNAPKGGAIRGKNFNRARQDAQDLMLALAPHGEPHGNALLWGLHRLDLIDKHQDLLALSHDVRSPALYFEGVRMPTTSNLPARLVFAQGGLFAGDEIVAALNLIAGEVEDTIQRFASLGW